MKTRFGRAYTVCAVLIFNSLIVVALLNAVAIPLLAWMGHRSEEAEILSRKPWLPEIYPNRSLGEVRQLLRETWDISWTYGSFVQFREEPYQGRYVHMTKEGYRTVENQSPWPPHPDHWTIFVFGGSTTFGYGLADEETVPSWLQTELSTLPLSRRPRVYNFGRASYYSSQERALFTKRLASGRKPDVAVFIDGINEFENFLPERELPAYTPQLKILFEESVITWPMLTMFLKRLPLAKLLMQVLPPRARPDDPLLAARRAQDKTVTWVIERYARNLQMISGAGQALGIQCLFVWQPVPEYGYDLAHHLFAHELNPDSSAIRQAGYRRMEQYAKVHFSPRDFLWAADCQASLAEPLYIDDIHYTSRMAHVLATVIAQELHRRGMTPLKGREP